MGKLLYPNSNMLLRIAQGDAYCMATEMLRTYEAASIVPAALEFKHYLPHPSFGIQAGCYTDDTQMSVAMVELLLDGHPTRIENDQKLYAEYFLRAFKRDPRKGYSKSFQTFFETCETADQFLQDIRPDSTKNGAAMRAVPLGILPDRMSVWKAAYVNASLTHNTRQGIFSSQAIALISHQALYTDKSFVDIAADLAAVFDEYEDVFLKPWAGEVVGHTRNDGWDVSVNTVWAVMTLLKEERYLLGILERIIRWGGDTDTVAAIAWGIASCRMTEHPPIFMDRDLEPGGNYGAQFLYELGDNLMRKYGSTMNGS